MFFFLKYRFKSTGLAPVRLCFSEKNRTWWQLYSKMATTKSNPPTNEWRHDDYDHFSL